MADNAELVAVYKRLRDAGRRLNARLTESLRDEELSQAARELGFYQRGRFEFENESEMAVLLDYCIHHLRTGALTAVDQLLREYAPADPDEAAVCQALRESYYSLFRVEEVVRGLGMYVVDLTAGEERILIIDLGLSQTAKPGLVLASRLLPFAGFAMTSGAALPLGVIDEQGRATLDRAIQATVADQPTDAKGIVRPGSLIRELISKGAAQRAMYAEAGTIAPRWPSSVRQSSKLRTSPAKRRLSRNDPCPCGSGQKYKNCCQRG